MAHRQTNRLGRRLAVTACRAAALAVAAGTAAPPAPAAEAPQAGAASTGPAPATAAPAYREPSLGATLFRPDELAADPATRARAASLLARYVAREMVPARPADVAAAARWLGVALRLDRESSDALVCNGLLRRGRPPAVLADAGPWDPAAAAAELSRIAGGWRATGRAGDRRAAAYVLALLADRRPADAPVQAELRALAAAVGPAEDRPLTWAWAGDAGGVRLASPPPGRLFANPVAYVATPADADPFVRAEPFSNTGAGIVHAAFGPGPSTLFWADLSGTVRLWDMAAGTEVRRFPHPKSRVVALQLSPDGGTLMTAAGPTVRLWDVATGKERRALTPAGPPVGYAPPDEVDDAALSPDGRYLIGSTNRRPAVLWALAVPGDKPAFEAAACPFQVSVVQFAPDSSALAIVEGAGVVVVRRLPDLTELGRFAYPKGDRATFALLAGGGRAVVDRAHDGLVVVDVASDLVVRKLTLPKGAGAGGSTVLTLLPDGRHVAQGTNSYELAGVRVWDAETGELSAVYPRPPGLFRTLTASPDGARLAATNNQGLRVLKVGG